MDTITESIHRRFLTHGTLYSDLALLDLRNFAEMSSDALPDFAFQECSKCLLRFDSRATAVNLHSQLKCLAAQWPQLKMSALEEYKVRMVGGGCDDDEKDTDILNKSCKECPVCCYQILKRYNLFTDVYHILGWARVGCSQLIVSLDLARKSPSWQH